ncbi:BspA family leucine-rich repeat surface protein [Segatella copri]|uniref:BspA family leucine-rich repeat surface protein n=1 Tax=Segatella copri TaxID=165179 RepID=UPI00294B1121|nr:BspA family leucine-rich repeat surface protein [Segatella copri]WOG32051.1 BspA family leucine-rich repeat surface protein [Segatella copri]
MKKLNNHSYGSHVGRMNYGGAKFCRFALFPLMLLMLLFLPTRMVAQTYPAYAEYDNATRTLTFKCGPSKPEEAYELNVGNNTPGWLAKRSKIEKVVFDASFANARPTSCYRWFADCYCLTKIEGIENLNTESVEDMSYMFGNCNSLSSLDLSKLNTAKVENMAYMFYYCRSLSSLNLSNINAANVKNMAYMFYYCRSLSSLNLSNINAANVTDMEHMFYYCRSLSSLNLSNINTANVKNMAYMFYYCQSLSSLNLSNINTANVTDMEKMFYSCSKLSSLDLTNFNTAKVKNMRSMFWNCSALTTIYVSDKFVTGQVTSSSDMFLYCSNLKGYSDSKIDHNYANCGTDGYFTPGCAYAEYDKATETLTFKCGLSKPKSAYDLNVGNNTPEWRKESEPELNDDEFYVPGRKIDISKVVFDASFANARPTSCYEWFDFCTSLTEIEGIENLNTEEVTNMGSMFSGCYDLTQLDVSNFNTQKVEDMSDMFVSCMALKSLNVSNFDTQKVKDMNDMFYNCNSLTSLDVSNFDTQNVENMSYMFSSCEGLNSLDLSNFDTQKVTNMNGMFWDSSALKTIYVSDKFVTTKVSSGADMFKGCTLLKGAIPEYEDSKTDHTYANYKTGYFSKLVGKNGDEKIGAAGDNLATDNLILADGKDFVAYETFAAKKASYSRTIKEGSKWGTLCLPFAIVQSQETECKFYRFTGIDAANECITLESCEEGIIPAGTPVLFKMNEGVKTLSISAQNTDLVKEPVAGTNTDVNLVGSFTKIGGNGNQGLDKNDYIIGKDKFWLVSELKDGKGVGIKPMRAYIHPATTSQARAAMLSIGKGDGTTAIDNLNAISNDANAEYYDANGRRTNGLQKGLNIVKRGSKTYKILVK